MDTLRSTNPYYIRCIKPNVLQQPNTFDNELVLTQLRYAGMLETVRIRKMGFPFRYILQDFYNRFIFFPLTFQRFNLYPFQISRACFWSRESF